MDKKKEVIEPKKAPIPFEEQMARRQSAPRPTPESEFQKMQMAQPQVGAMDGFKALAQVIGREQIQAAQPDKYKETPMAMFLDIPKENIKAVSRRPRMEIIDGD